MKNSKLNFKVYLISFILAIATIGIIIFFFHADSVTNQKNLEYINSFGWEVTEKPEEIVRLTIPEVFKGSGTTRYSYKVLNHINSSTGLIRINLFLIKGDVAAAFISSLEPDGFISPINDTANILKNNN